MYSNWEGGGAQQIDVFYGNLLNDFKLLWCVFNLLHRNELIEIVP